MSRRTRHAPAARSPRSPGPARKSRPEPPPPLPLAHPAARLALLVAAACIAVTVSDRISDPDLWQHLLVGKAIWTTHSIPMTHQWTWPSYGRPDVLPSWGFRAALWPFWRLGGVPGLYAWRWLTTLGAFALLWAAARRMGSRGLAAPVALVLCALVYRQRTMVRPETLVAVLLAAQIWILETRRHGGPDRAWWLVGIAWLWANVHLSYFLGLALLGIYALDEWRTRRRFPRALALAGLAALAASFANPFGARALWQPFDFWLHGRSEAIFRGINELRPITWKENLRNGLPLLVAGWPLIVLVQLARRRLDLAGALGCALFTWLGLSSQRFLGLYAIVAAPHLAGGADALMRAVPRPRWTAGAFARAGLAALACVGLSLPEWSRVDRPLGLGLDETHYPVAACDFMRAHGVRGHGFNPFHLGGYLLWRFWPDPGRLPFMDIHQSGTRTDRDLVAGAVSRRDAWRALDDERRFDYALLDRLPVAGEYTLDFLDADSAYALVFADDAGALYVRRHGALAAIADSFAYGGWPAGRQGLDAAARAFVRDPAFRIRAKADLEREVRSSPRHAVALNTLANLALIERDDAEAERRLHAALEIDPALPEAHRRLASIALRQGRPDDAIREFELERAHAPGAADLDFLIGSAWARRGDRARAREAYQRALRRDPSLAAARDSLDALGASPRAAGSGRTARSAGVSAARRLPPRRACGPGCRRAPARRPRGRPPNAPGRAGGGGAVEVRGPLVN